MKKYNSISILVFVIISLVSFQLTGCAKPKVKKGKHVVVDFKGRTDQGLVLNSKNTNTPYVFTVGEGKTLPGLEKAVIGMRQGEQKEITLLPEEAYGGIKENFTKTLLKKDLHPGIRPEVGKVIRLRNEKGEAILGMVKKVNPESVVVDLNHPLAGQTFKLKITVREIK